MAPLPRSVGVTASSHYLVSRYPGQLAVADVHAMAQPENFAFAVRAASALLQPLNAFIDAHRAEY